MRLGVLALVLILVAPAPSALAEDGIADEDARLELHLEDRRHPPHPGEMILISIRGTFRVPVVREKLREPPLYGFDWMQLGRDHWYKELEDGFEVVKFERRMALFPQAPGKLEIPAFTHELELLSRSGKTVKISEQSNTLPLTAVPAPETSQWWFPVRKINVTDRWSNAPEGLAPASAALRIVTLILEGTTPQSVPPMPELTGAGAYIFPHPEHRTVTLGPNGPVTHVFWRWTVRPKEDTAGYLDPVEIVYFDTRDRAEKHIRLSAQRIAYAGGAQTVRAAGGSAGRPVAGTSSGGALLRLPGWSVPAMLALGLLAGLWVGLSGPAGGRLRFPGWLRPSPEQIRLRRAVRSGDAHAVRRYAHMLIRRHGAPPPAALRQLDHALFGSGTNMPDLRKVARAASRTSALADRSLAAATVRTYTASGDVSRN